jgi:Na+-driven multidrug efflux pump
VCLSTSVSTPQPVYCKVPKKFIFCSIFLYFFDFASKLSCVFVGLQMLWPVTIINFFLSTVDVVTNYLFVKVFGWGVLGAPLGINSAFLVGLVVAIAMLLRRSTSSLYTLRPWRSIPPKTDALVFIKDSFNLMSRSILVEMASFLVPLFVGQLPGSLPLTALGQVVLELSKYSIFIPQCFGSCANILGINIATPLCLRE